MKRMVENSEKIEELVKTVNIDNNGNVEIDGNVEFNSKLITSNITTTDGTKINIINEEKYDFRSIDLSLHSLNLGTAIVITGAIDVSMENGEYELMVFNTDNMEPIILLQLTGYPVCTIVEYTDAVTHTDTIKIRLNKAVAEYPVASEYNFSFIIGRYGKEV